MKPQQNLDRRTDLVVWKALSDPTRREILDMLRLGPRTTGDLAAHFEQTRFGVMKHLNVLVESGLVTVERSGRERWNYLNPMPIHEISRRWIRPFEESPADRLLRLQQHAELTQELTMKGTHDFRTLDIRLSIEIGADRDVIWKSMTESINEWWPAKFYVGKAPKRFVLEGRVGGRVYEDWGDGEGALFGQIVTFEEGRVLQWAADMSADFGGPARTLTTFELKAGQNETTRVEFRDTPYGLLSDAAVQHLEAGWRWLLEECLKGYIENGKKPERPPTVA